MSQSSSQNLDLTQLTSTKEIFHNIERGHASKALKEGKIIEEQGIPKIKIDPSRASYEVKRNIEYGHNKSKEDVDIIETPKKSSEASPNKTPSKTSSSELQGNLLELKSQIDPYLASNEVKNNIISGRINKMLAEKTKHMSDEEIRRMIADATYGGRFSIDPTHASKEVRKNIEFGRTSRLTAPMNNSKYQSPYSTYSTLG